MLKKLKRVISGVLVATIVLSFAGENLVQVQAAEVSTDSVEKLEASDVRTALTYLDGTQPGDTHLVYSYQENGKKYKIVEDTDADFSNVYSTIYLMDSEGNYNEVKTQEVKNDENGKFELINRDVDGKVDIQKINTKNSVQSIDSTMAGNGVARTSNYTDPGLGEWITKTWDGSSRIYNMTITAITSVLSSAMESKVGKALVAIAGEYFKKNASQAYYHVVDNWMMSKLYPTWCVIREATYTSYYFDSAHRNKTGTDYYEYDGRW